MSKYRVPKREYQRTCKVCFKQYFCSRVTSKYCSNACRQVHKRIVLKQRQDYAQSKIILDRIASNSQN